MIVPYKTITDNCIYIDYCNNCKHKKMKRAGLLAKIFGERKPCLREIIDRDDGVMPKCDIFKSKED